MPKKPKHIQDKVDQLIKENHTSKEIIEIIKKENHDVSNSYISSRRKKLQKLEEKKETPKTSTSPGLSNDSFRLLYNLMGMLGKETLDDTIKTISNDYREIVKEKYRYDIDNEKSVAQVFMEFLEAYKIMETLDKNESQLKIYEKMTLKEYPFKYYQIRHMDYDGGYSENLFDFLADSTVKYWRDERGVEIVRFEGNPLVDPSEVEKRELKKEK